MIFPQFTLAKHWRHQPFLLRHGEQRFLALFSDEKPAAQFAGLYALQPPQGVASIDSPEEVILWAQAAIAAGAQTAWLDPLLSCQAVDPVRAMPLVELIDLARELSATPDA